EYQLKINKASQELGQIRAQLAGKQRERKLTELTSSELAGFAGAETYRTVGRMFLKEDVNILAGELAAKIAVCSKEIAAMEKVALKTDQDLKDAERNLTSLINKVKEQGGVA
ncbi:hypothetical protein HDU91_001470, partial [Kappamyces sp. JEL0680]